MNLDKLAPAPWKVIGEKEYPQVDMGNGYLTMALHGMDSCVCDIETAEFIAMARNAFAGDPEALAWWESNRIRPASE